MLKEALARAEEAQRAQLRRQAEQLAAAHAGEPMCLWHQVGWGGWLFERGALGILARVCAHLLQKRACEKLCAPLLLAQR